MQFTIAGLSGSANQADYRFLQTKLGITGPTQYASNSQITYTVPELVDILEYTDPDRALCFKVINRSTGNEFPEQCVSVSIGFPDTNFAESIDCSAMTAPTVTYDEGDTVVNTQAGKPYLSTSRVNSFAFDLSTCANFNTANHAVRYVQITQGADMEAATCGLRGTCAKENIDCSLRTMSCSANQGDNKYTCVDLWGFSVATGEQVTDDNGATTIRVDHKGDCFLQNKISKHPLDVASSTLKDCYDPAATSCYNSIPTSCMAIFAAQTSDPSASTATASSTECETLRSAINDYEEAQESQYEKRGFNKRQQFVFSRSEAFFLNLWLQNSHFDIKTNTQVEVNVAPWANLTITSQDRTLTAHFLMIVTTGGVSSFGYFKLNLDTFVWAQIPYAQ